MGIALAIVQWLGIIAVILIVLQFIIGTIVSIFNVILFLSGTIKAVAEYQQAKLAETLSTSLTNLPEGFQFVEGRETSST